MSSANSTELAWVAGVGHSAGLGAALARRFARGGLQVLLTHELDLRPFKERF